MLTARSILAFLENNVTQWRSGIAFSIPTMPKFKAKNSQKKPQKGGKSTYKPLTAKDKVALKRQEREKSQKLFTSIGISLFLAFFIGLPLFLVDLKIGAAATIVLPTVALSYFYPRMALWAFLIYMPLSGTITYTLGGGSSLFQLSKDIFYIPALFALIVECRRNRQPILVSRQLNLTLAILCICSLLTLFFVNGHSQLFLPSCDTLSEKYLTDAAGNYILDPTTNRVIAIPCRNASNIPIAQGLLGLKVFLGYIPLIFCGYYLIDSKEKLVLLGRVLLVLAIICCALGLVQYYFLTSGRCEGSKGAIADDIYRASLQARCFVGGALLYSPEYGQIRLPGTFVSPWHWAWFLIANSAITFTVAFCDPKFFWRMAGLAGIAIVWVNAVISGQRIAFALVPVLLLTLVILTGQIANLKRFLPIGIGLGVIFAILLASKPEIIQERLDSFIARWNTAPPYSFILGQFGFAIGQQKSLLGLGLGTATNSARIFGNVVLVETYHPKVLYEVGTVGLIAFMAFITRLCQVTFKCFRSLKEKILRNFAACFWVFLLIIGYFPYWYPLDTDPVAVYFWMFAGMMLRFPQIDKKEREKEQKMLEEHIEQVKQKKFKRIKRTDLPNYGV
jgi:hypothetical protein